MQGERNKGKDWGKPSASSTALGDITGWVGRAGVGLSPWSRMLLHPSVPFLPSVFPVLGPSGLPHMLSWALLVSQILHVPTHGKQISLIKVSAEIME